MEMCNVVQNNDSMVQQNTYIREKVKYFNNVVKSDYTLSM